MYKILFTRVFFLSVIGALLFASCAEETTIDLDDTLYGYEYFPIDIGKYWTYRVDSTIVDDGGLVHIDTRSYVKEEVVDHYFDNLGEEVFIIQRSYSEDPVGPFKVMDAWTAQLAEDAAIRTEENLRFVKLVFPATENARWTGNRFDPLTEVDVAGESIWVYKDWGDYFISDRNAEVNSNGIIYEDCLVVDQADFESAVERRISREFYAPGVGLIKKEMTILDTQCLCPGESWEEKAEAGFILRQVLIESN